MRSFRVLFVCTGNLCRSPISEYLLRSHIAGSAVEVTSAGTHAYPDHPIDTAAAAALRELGIDPRAHRTTRLRPDHVERADLVLTASLEHRRYLLGVTPSAIRRTFSLREFARLGAALAPPTSDDLPARVAEVAAQRGLLEPGPDDIADPFAAPYGEMQRCAAVIDGLVRETVSILGLTPAADLVA